ncbi:Ferric iron ABC transporter, permease protein [Klebsiella pneumoniae IS43]|uniref:Ferric iron ABC transporter, permease protein n=1 Tax=Klebsiella pneumoniae IS43 TaxID=1432552 RepID=W1DMZ7_KLEPN|nr:Ferric iron ABC transporter, permease protein [Klebsiella pneumoniae IS43]
MIPFLRRWPPEDPQLQEPVVKQTFLSGATLAALVMLVALPLVFIVLQAIFSPF